MLRKAGERFLWCDQRSGKPSAQQYGALSKVLQGLSVVPLYVSTRRRQEGRTGSVRAISFGTSPGYKHYPRGALERRPEPLPVDVIFGPFVGADSVHVKAIGVFSA